MSVNVLFFGATADVVGTRELALDAMGLSAAELRDRLVVDHPGLAKHKLLLSVNQEFVAGDEAIHDGDEVAVFTAVSGG